MGTLIACGDGSETVPGAAGGGGAGAGPGAGGSVSGCMQAPLAPGDHEFMLAHGGLDRTYNLYLPEGYDGASPIALVMNFHGYTSNAAQQAFFSDMNPTADVNGFAVVYAEGHENSWNGGACCGNAAAEGIDDVGFARAMVADIATRACIDDKRVYSTGMSNGGFISNRIACEASDLVAAIAPVCGGLGIACSPSRPVPVMAFNGTEDPLFTYNLAVATNDAWIEADECTGTPEVTLMEGAATCETLSMCAGGVEVTHCSIEGMGHCWPGQSFCPRSLGAPNVDISANEQMWAFFQRYTLP
jgi:polyhydroxybutyrate depolymerase